MKKIKLSCFRHKRYTDIYVNRASFSTDKLLSILDIFPNQKVVVIIDSDEDYIQTLSTVCKSIEITEVILRLHLSIFIIACNKSELISLLSQADIDKFENLFIASIHNDIISDELINSLEHVASSLVKKGVSDILINFIFPEYEMEISLLNEKYELKFFKDKILSIFGN